MNKNTLHKVCYKLKRYDCIRPVNLIIFAIHSNFNEADIIERFSTFLEQNREFIKSMKDIISKIDKMKLHRYTKIIEIKS